MFRWKEVFMGTNREDFEQAKQKLVEHNIRYKVKIKDDNLRLPMSNLDGRQGAALTRFGNKLNTYYYLYVKSGNEGYSKNVLHRQ